MRPILFSEKFGVPSEAFDEANLLDAYVDTDTPLFIDPLLINKSANEIVRYDGIEQFRAYFDKVVRLLAMTEEEGDPAWIAAERLLSLKEPAENGLGYSRSQRAGASRPREVRSEVLRTIQKVIRLGSKDPEMLSLMGFLEPGIGPDTISDFTTIAMADALARLTSDFCSQHSVETQENTFSDHKLPMISRKGELRPVVLVPRDILRDLPVAESWGDVWEAIEHNSALRERLSVLLAGIARPTVTEQKEAVKRAVLRSGSTFDAFLEAVKDAASAYDANLDIKGFYAFRDLLNKLPDLRSSNQYDIRRDPGQVLQVVKDALNVFKHHVENGNLWEELWADGQPKKERAAQLLFFAIADAYCRAHEVDNVSEPNFGGGPVDFSFGDGCKSRVIVEMKRSTGSVVNGYNKQLDRYKKAARTEYAVFVVIDFGLAGGAQKLKQIQRARDLQIARGERASEIVVIDARKKASPSKLR